MTVGDKNLPLYLVQPSADAANKKGCILVIPDIYSVRYLTTQVRSGDRIGLICDMLANAGYTVGLAGIFRDAPFDLAVKGPDDGNFEKFNSFAQEGGVDWFKKYNYDAVGPDVKAAAAFLKETTGGNQPLGVLGFCFGTWALSKTSAMGDVDFACGVGCHPATALEGLYGGDEVAMMNSVKMPIKFLWAGKYYSAVCITFTAPESEKTMHLTIVRSRNQATIRTFTRKGGGQGGLGKAGGSVEEYTEMLHGWVSRGDMADEKVKRDVERRSTRF